jgi:hypothetical protein
MVDESKLSFSFSFVLTSLSGLTKKTPWAILRGRAALRETLTTNDLGFWMQWILVGGPSCMTLLERWGEGLAVRVMNGNGVKSKRNVSRW